MSNRGRVRISEDHLKASQPIPVRQEDVTPLQVTVPAPRATGVVRDPLEMRAITTEERWAETGAKVRQYQRSVPRKKVRR